MERNDTSLIRRSFVCSVIFFPQTRGLTILFEYIFQRFGSLPRFGEGNKRERHIQGNVYKLTAPTHLRTVWLDIQQYMSKTVVDCPLCYHSFAIATGVVVGTNQIAANSWRTLLSLFVGWPLKVSRTRLQLYLRTSPPHFNDLFGEELVD